MSPSDVSYTDYLDYPYSQLRVEIDTYGGDVVSFVIQLEYNFDPRFGYSDDWKQVARFDHHPNMTWGHDITREGLHMDVYRNGRKELVSRSFPNVPLNKAPAYCVRYLKDNHDTLVNQFERWHNRASNNYSSSP